MEDLEQRKDTICLKFKRITLAAVLRVTIGVQGHERGDQWRVYQNNLGMRLWWFEPKWEEKR